MFYVRLLLDTISVICSVEKDIDSCEKTIFKNNNKILLPNNKLLLNFIFELFHVSLLW